MRGIVVLLTVVVALAANVGPVFADHVAGGAKVHKVVFQVISEDPKVWDATVRGISHVVHTFGKESVDIRLVATLMGIHMFQKGKSPVLERLQSLRQFVGPQRVKYTACIMAQRAVGMKPEDIPDFVEDRGTPGLERVIEYQEAGFVLIPATFPEGARLPVHHMQH